MMTRELWESLQGNPGWMALRDYLRDHRMKIMKKWANGELRGSDGDAASQQCAALGDIASIEWRDVARFYDLWTDKDETEYHGGTW